MSLADELAAELEALDRQGLRRRLRPIDGPQAAEITVDGRHALNFSSNNYLGLADHPALSAAARACTEQLGTGAGASRLIAGSLAPHRELEGALADLLGQPALLFNSGYQANLGLIQALAGPEDAVFSDALNHASLIDGCRLARARVEVYAHRDHTDLRQRLAATPARRRLIVTDSVFSMDGDVADLAGLRQLANEHGAALLVDDAHAFGVMGPGGRGACAAAGVQPDALMATFGKALGGFGAFVSAAPPVVDYLANRARSFVFTTALPPGVMAAAHEGLRLVASPAGAERRAQLHQRIRQFADGLAALGLLVDGAGATPIFPVLVGDARQTMEASEALLQAGVFAQGIRPPTVPRGTARLRFSLMATHTGEHVQRALDGLCELRDRGLIPVQPQ
jgi:8-amino-7-oxononanoate synthase